MTHRLQERHLKVLSSLKKNESPDDTFSGAMSLYYQFKKTGTCESGGHLHAFRIFEDPVQREILEALLLSGAEHTDIFEIFGIPHETIRVFAELFYDTTAFFSKLDVISYLETYQGGDFGRELKIRAYNLGPEFVFYRYGNTTPSTESQKNLLKRMFLISAYRGAEAQFNPISSKVSKAALDWSKTMIKAYEALERFTRDEDPGAGNNLLKIIASRELSSGGVIQQINPEDVV